MHDYYSEEEEISVEGLIEEQRRLSASKNPFERVVGTLCVAGLLKERLAALTRRSNWAIDARLRLERTESFAARERDR